MGNLLQIRGGGFFFAADVSEQKAAFRYSRHGRHMAQAQQANHPRNQRALVGFGVGASRGYNFQKKEITKATVPHGRKRIAP